MHRTTTLFIAVIATAALVLAACGDDDDGATVGTEDNPRTIEVDMEDIEFSPDQVEVQDGETVRFVFHNKGAVPHDAFIGDEDAQEEHEMEMREMDDMGEDMGGHDEGEEGGITVMPGETGEITHTFHADDDVMIGCHEPGHYDAGMIMTIDVA